MGEGRQAEKRYVWSLYYFGQKCGRPLKIPFFFNSIFGYIILNVLRDKRITRSKLSNYTRS